MQFRPIFRGDILWWCGVITALLDMKNLLCGLDRSFDLEGAVYSVACLEWNSRDQGSTSLCYGRSIKTIAL